MSYSSLSHNEQDILKAPSTEKKKFINNNNVPHKNTNLNYDINTYLNNFNNEKSNLNYDINTYLNHFKIENPHINRNEQNYDGSNLDSDRGKKRTNASNEKQVNFQIDNNLHDNYLNKPKNYLSTYQNLNDYSSPYTNNHNSRNSKHYKLNTHSTTTFNEEDEKRELENYNKKHQAVINDKRNDIYIPDYNREEQFLTNYNESKENTLQNNLSNQNSKYKFTIEQRDENNFNNGLEMFDSKMMSTSNFSFEKFIKKSNSMGMINSPKKIKEDFKKKNTERYDIPEYLSKMNRYHSNTKIQTADKNFNYVYPVNYNNSNVVLYLEERHLKEIEKINKMRNEQINRETAQMRDRPVISENSKKILEQKQYYQSNKTVFDRLTDKTQFNKKIEELKTTERIYYPFPITKTTDKNSKNKQEKINELYRRNKDKELQENPQKINTNPSIIPLTDDNFSELNSKTDKNKKDKQKLENLKNHIYKHMTRGNTTNKNRSTVRSIPQPDKNNKKEKTDQVSGKKLKNEENGIRTENIQKNDSPKNNSVKSEKAVKNKEKLYNKNCLKHQRGRSDILPTQKILKTKTQIHKSTSGSRTNIKEGQTKHLKTKQQRKNSYNKNLKIGEIEDNYSNINKEQFKENYNTERSKQFEKANLIDYRIFKNDINQKEDQSSEIPQQNITKNALENTNNDNIDNKNNLDSLHHFNISKQQDKNYKQNFFNYNTIPNAQKFQTNYKMKDFIQFNINAEKILLNNLGSLENN